MAFRVTDVVVVPDRVLTREHVMLESDHSAGRPTSQMRIYAPICLFRERLTGTGGVERLFQRFDEVLRAVGYLAMGGQIVDAIVIQAPRPRLIRDNGRWPIKRGRKPPPSARPSHEPAMSEIVVPIFGYKNYLGIDRRHGLTVTDAARHDGAQRAKLLDRRNTASAIWADTAYRSAVNVALLVRRGLVPQLQRANPRSKPMPPYIARGNATGRASARPVEHVFPAQKCRLGLLIRSVGLARATTRLGLAKLVTNMTRLAWLQSRPAPV